MFSWLKKHFIPHEGNEHRPHILRHEKMRHIVAIILCLEIAAFVVPSILNMNLLGGMAAVLPAVLGGLTNENRQAQNLPTLSLNPLLARAAQMKAQDMAEKGYFAHTSPEGLTPWYWIELAGYKYQYAGENLAVNFRDSEDVTAAWLASPTHKANIIKGQYTEMGTGVAEGYYKGKKSIFVAQVYANPLPIPISSNIIPISVPVQTFNPALAPIPQVLGEEVVAGETPIKTSSNPSSWHKLLASPRNTTNVLLGTIFILAALALMLYLIIKKREHHPDLLGNGLAMLAIAGAVIVANYYISFGSMEISQSYDYALEDTL